MTDRAEKNYEIARRWFLDMWSKPDMDAADEIVSPDYDPDWIHIDRVGPEQVKHEIRYFRSVFPDLEYEIIDSIASEDRIWVRYRGSGSQAGSAWGFDPTNRHVDFEGATILYINHDGKITYRWGAFCFYDILTELGITPPIWELKDRLEDPGD